jgi:CHAT domain-containing protein
MRASEFAEALGIATRAASRYDPRDPWYWRFEFLRAEILITRGEYSKAREILARQIPRVPGIERLEARRLCIEGWVLSREEKFEQARRVLERGAAAAAAAGDVETMRACHLGRAQAYISEGDLEQGARLSTALARESESAGDYYHQGAALLNAGNAYFRLSRYETGIEFSMRAGQAARNCGDVLLEASALGNLADCRLQLGEFDLGLEDRRRCTVLFKHSGAQRFFMQSLGELGTGYLLAGKTELAMPELRHAIELAGRLDLRADRAEFSAKLAHALIETGQLDKAERLNGEAHGYYESKSDTSGLAAARLNEARLLASRGRDEDALRMFSSVLDAPGDDPRTLWEAHAGMARLLDRGGKEQQASVAFERAVAAIDKTRAGLERQDSAISFQTGVDRIYREYAELLIRRKEDERALEIVDSGRARALSGRLAKPAPPRRRLRAASLMELARREKVAILAYWTGPVRSYVWAITPSAFRLVPLEAEGPLRDLVAGYRETLERTTRDPLTDRHGEALCRKLIEPVAPLLEGIGQIVIVPDGPLHSLNLETLPVPGPKPHYWIQETGVRIVPSLALMETAAAGAHHPGGLLLIGDPVPVPDYPRLANAGTEIEAVGGSSHGGLRKITGAEATPEAYLESRPGQFQWIHFTAHGRASAASPLDSAVILSKGRSGPALKAWDVLQTPIQAQLVTISACRGAGVRAYLGEGTVGFAWAFLKAGASNVVAGLWDVDDRATSMLMERMYRGLARGRSPAVALRDAKLALIASGSLARPLYWGPFQVYSRGLR